MATTATQLTLEEFHRQYEGLKPYYEFWYGEAVAKPMPTTLHGAAQFVLMLLLRARGWKPSSEVRLKISEDFEPVPDIVASRTKLETPYPTRPVELCIEILSPEDRLSRMVEKTGHYL